MGNLLLLLFLTFLPSCENNNACIDADDFGETEKETVIVKPYSSGTCLMSSSDRESNYASVINDRLRNCLILANCSTGGQECQQGQTCNSEENLKKLCEESCVSACEDFKQEPLWVTNNPSGTYGNGVSIGPNKLIYVTVSGEIKLRNGYNNGEAQGCINGRSNVPYLGQYGDCVGTQEGITVGNGSYSIQFDINLVKPELSSSSSFNKDFYNVTGSNLLLFQKYPKGYDATSKIPLNSDPDYTSCIQKYPNDTKKISCSEGLAIDNYLNTYDKDVSSKAFNFGTDNNFLISNGGYLRSNNDFYNEEEITLNDNNIIIANTPTSQEITLKEINYRSDEFIEMKVNDNACSGYVINSLNILEGSAIHYSTTNLRLFTQYSNKIIPYYKSSQIKLIIPNSSQRLNSNGEPCYKNIQIKRKKYHDILMPNSGFVQFKIKDLSDYSYDDLFGSLVKQPVSPLTNGHIICPTGKIITKFHIISNLFNNLKGVGVSCATLADPSQYSRQLSNTNLNFLGIGSGTNSENISNSGFQEIEVIKDASEIKEIKFNSIISSASSDCLNAGENCKKINCSGGKISGIKAQFDSSSIKAISVICQDNNGPIANQNSCTLYGRIINPNGEKTEIKDSYSGTSYIKTYLANSNISMPSSTGKKVASFSVGLNTYSHEKDFHINSSNCFKKIELSTCNIGSDTCQINQADNNFATFLASNCKDGNGENSLSQSDGGGGGGNSGGLVNKNGSSFINLEFNDNYDLVNNNDNQNSDGNGMVKITDSRDNVIYNSNNTNLISLPTYTLPNDKIVRYEIRGGDGGNDFCNNKNGAKGDYITGTLKFPNYFSAVNLKIKAGAKGTGGSACLAVKNAELSNVNNLEAFEFATYGIPIIYKKDITIYEENPHCQSSNYLSNFIAQSYYNRSSSFSSTQLGLNAPSCLGGSDALLGLSQNLVKGPSTTKVPGGVGGGNGFSLYGNNKISYSYYNPLFHNKKPTINFSAKSDSSVKINNNIINQNNFSVPAGTESLTYEICGAKGGNYNGNSGANGFCISGTISNLPNSGVILNFFKGNKGVDGTRIGATEGNFDITPGSGGGAMAIYANIEGVNQLIAVAGGGSGAGANIIDNSNTISNSDRDLLLLPYSNINIQGVSDPQIILKYYQGDSVKDNIDIRNKVLNNNLQSYTFSAPLGYKISKVSFASYGNPIIDGENYLINPSCHYKATKQKIANLCVNQQSCTINFNTDFNSASDLAGQDCTSTEMKLAIKLEFAKNLENITINRSKTNTANITLQPPANQFINDIIFASYGNPSATNNTPPFYTNGTCYSQDVEERIRVMCLGKSSCSFSSADLGITTGNCASITKELAIVYSSIPKNSINPESNSTSKLKGGNGTNYSGAGGSASYISIVRSDEGHDNTREDFVLIAGGGAGGSLNSIATNNYNRQNHLETNANGYTFAVQYSNTNGSSTQSDYYEYGDYISGLNQALDPISELKVGTTEYTSEFFLRKGQIMRILPKTFEKLWNSKEGPKECGVGMMVKITPRPALMCLNTKKTITIKNPSCSPNYEGATSTFASNSNGVAITEATNPNVEQKGCSLVTCTTEEERKSAWDAFTRNQNYNNVTFCPDPTCSKVTCSGGSASTAQSCSNQAPSGSISCLASVPEPQPTDSNKQIFYNQKTCENCRAAKIASNENPTLQLTDPKECYDFENSNNVSVYKLINSGLNPSTKDINQDSLQKYNIIHFQDLINNELFIYKNFRNSFRESKVSSTYNMDSSIELDNQGRLLGLNINNNDFQNLKFGSPLPSAETNFKFLSLKSRGAYRNGQHLNVALCKESSDSSVDCKKVEIPLFTKKVFLTDGKTEIGSQNYFNFKDSGELFKIKDLDGNFIRCSNLPSTYQNDKSFVCFMDDNGNSNEANKYRLAFKIVDSDGRPSPTTTNIYDDNSGEYQVTIKTRTLNPSSSVRIVNAILSPILENLDGVKDNPSTPTNEYKSGILKTFYIYLINNLVFQNILTITAVLAISFFGMGFLMGINEIKHSEVVKIVLKIGFVYLFISPVFGWYWFEAFFVNFFKHSVDFLCFLVAETFDSSAEIKNRIQSGDFSDKAVLFDSVNNVVSLIFSDVVQNKVLALLFSSIFGWIYFIIIFYCFLTYFYAIANSVLLYVTCQVVTSILMVLGPLMFLFLFFNITKDIFDNWIKALIGFGLQQIFLVLTLTFFNSLIILFLKLALGYRVCWTEVLSLNLFYIKVSLFNFWTVAGTNSPSTFSEVDAEESFGNSQNMPSLYLFLILVIIVNLMKKFIELFTDLAAAIAGGVKASTIGGDVASFGKSAFNFASSQVSKLYNNTAGRALDNIDNYVFASGKIAKQERIAKMTQFKEDMKTRATLSKEGNLAVSDYKKNNALALSQKSPAEQKATLENVRKQAIKDYAQDNGIKNVDAIMDKKGFNYAGGTNLFGVAFQAAKQGVKSGGNLFNSINDKQASASFSKSEANSAIKSMNKKEQDAFISNVEKGAVYVKKGNVENARKIAINVLKSPSSIAKAVINPKSTATSALSSAKEKIIKAYKGDSDLKNMAIKELEQAGKIAKYDKGFVNDLIPSALKTWARTDEDKRLIRDKMREIADTRSVASSNKITSQSTVRDLKATQQYVEDTKKYNNSADFDNKNKSSRAQSKRFGRRLGNMFKRDEQNSETKQDKIANMIKENALKLKDNNEKDIKETQNKLNEFKEALNVIDKNLQSNETTLETKKLIDSRNEIGAKFIEASNKLKTLKLKQGNIERMAKTLDDNDYGKLAKTIVETSQKNKEEYEKKGIIDRFKENIKNKPLIRLATEPNAERKKYEKSLDAIKDYKKIKDFVDFEKFCKKYGSSENNNNNNNNNN